MTALAAPEFLDLLKPAIEARGDIQALDPVPTVYTHWPTIDWSVSDSIILGYDVSATIEPAAVGRNRVDEDATLDSQIRIMRAGAGETIAKNARDRAKALYQAVDNELRSNHPELVGANDDIMWARCGSYELAQFPMDIGSASVSTRVAVVTFQIIYKARLAVS